MVPKDDQTPPSARRAALAFLAAALPAMAVLYMAIYFPYRRGSFPERALSAYVVGIAGVAGRLLQLFDARVGVARNMITGPMPLTVILDCTALDAQMLLAAAIFAFNGTWRQKLVGLVGGLGALMLLNLARIIVLYVVGLRWPAAFHLVHEEICQFVIVAAAFTLFAVWARWVTAASGSSGSGPSGVEKVVAAT